MPDTLDGRFDMIAAILALVLLRLEAEGEAGRGPSVLLTEIFIDDMDGTLRQIGIGDYVVGKHVGRMMGALGGRLAAFRAGRRAGLAGRRGGAQRLPRGAALGGGAGLRRGPARAVRRRRSTAPVSRTCSAAACHDRARIQPRRSASTRSASAAADGDRGRAKASARRWPGASACSRSTGSRRR